MTDRCHIVTLSLSYLGDSHNVIGLVVVQNLSVVLGQCPTLVHLDLSDNNIRSDEAEILAGVLGHCKALAHLNLDGNLTGSVGPVPGQRTCGECLCSAQR